MDQIYPKLYRQYIRENMRLCGGGDCGLRGKIDVNDVLRAHFLLCDYFIREGESIALAGARSDDLLVSAVHRQFTGMGKVNKWKTPYEQVATVFYGLIKNHPFHDGNKRTAYLIALLHLLRHGLVPEFKQKEFEAVTVQTAASALVPGGSDLSAITDPDNEVRRIAGFLKTGTRKSDKRRYQVTYRDLNTIFQRFGFRLQDPNKNFIDLVRVTNKRRLRGVRIEKVEETTRIFNVAFPGWTRVVPGSTVKVLRKEAKLTPAYGYDSAVFFKGHDSLPALIAEYHGPLLRLKDK